MAKIFEIRPNNLNAHYSTFANTVSLLGATPPILSGDGTFSGGFINKSSATLKGLYYPGYTNTPPTSSFSARIRIIPRYTGFPSVNQTLWGMGGPGTAAPFNIELTHLTTGDIRFRFHTDTGSATNFSSTATVSPTSGTAFDLMIVVDGVAETLKSSINGVQLHSGGIATSHAAFNNQLIRPMIYFGLGIGGANAQWDLVNFELWDTVENHVHAVRTGFDSTPAYEGFPVAGDVRSGITYGYTNEGRVGTYAPPTAPTAVEVATAVWDRVLTGGTHNIPASAGRRLRQLNASSITSGTAQAGTSNSITLEAGASPTDEIYDSNLLVIIDGTGVGQTRIIVEYNGASKIAYVDRVWEVTPDATSVYEVLADSQASIAQHGVAQGGTATTITLSSTASSVDDIYVGSHVFISTSNGTGQTRIITAYNGTTKTATISPAWLVEPTSVSVYKIIPIGRSIVETFGDQAKDDVSGAIWNKPTSEHTVSGSFGAFIQKLLTMNKFLAVSKFLGLK